MKTKNRSNRVIIFILLLAFFGAINFVFAKAKTDNKGLANIQEIMANGAGKSGKVPEGLLNAEGIQKKLTDQTPECSASTTCGSSCVYGGVTYHTVLIGDQCWFKENLNVGTMIGNLETPDDTAPTPNNPATVSKWCFDDTLANCDSEGGLYSWAEANALPNFCNSTSCSVPTVNQGICPSGWHIPSDAEQHTLENYLKTAGESCDAARSGWDCSGAGAALVLGGSSGFDAISAGNHETNGDLSWFDKREPSAHFWSSSPCLNCSNWGHSYSRGLVISSDSDMVHRGVSHNEHGFSVRCLADHRQ
jgi:uncharacterized protein (TIGR02145 family)